MDCISPGTLSTLIFQIYAASRSGEVTAFQRRVIDLLGRQISFDKAWWGRGTASGGQHHVHCSFVWQMPQDLAERFNMVDPQNIVARATFREPGRAHYFSHAQLVAEPGTRDLTAHMNIAQSICLGELDSATGVSTFISIARTSSEPPFSRSDMQLLELVNPHLSASLDMALADELGSQRNPEQTTLMVADAIGVLRVLEPGAVALLRTEWPGWSGPILPAPLVDHIKTRRREYLGRALRVDIRWSGDHSFLTVRPREATDLLSRQEKAVALAFASGQSYREVAEQLQLSPATVRHHLRTAYVKLGVNDKAAFATRLKGG